MRDLRWLICIFVVSLIVRTWYASTHLVFENDMARDALVIQQALDSGNWLIGYGPKTSVGNFYTAPFYYHLHLLLSAVTNNHPLTMTIFVILVEALTPLVLFMVVRFFLSARSAAAVALLFAVGYLPVTFGTRAWNPTMIPFFSTLSLLGWLQYLGNRKQWGIVVGLVAAAIVFYLHFQAVVLFLFAASVFGYSLWHDRSSYPQWLLAGICILLTLFPYILVEYRDNWSNTLHIWSYYTTEHSEYYDRVSKPDYVLSFFPSFIERLTFGKENTGLLYGRLLFFGGFTSVLFWLRAEWVRLSRPKLAAFLRVKKVRVFVLICVYLLSIFIMLRAYKGDKLDYYLSVLFILPALLSALVLHLLPRIGLFFVGLSMLFSLNALVAVPQFNQLAEIEEIFSQLRSFEQSGVQFLFADERIAHSFGYHINRDFPDIGGKPALLVLVSRSDGAQLAHDQEEFKTMVLEKKSQQYAVSVFAQ